MVVYYILRMTNDLWELTLTSVVLETITEKKYLNHVDMYAFVYIRLKIFVTKYTDCFHVNHSKYTGRNNHKKDGRRMQKNSKPCMCEDFWTCFWFCQGIFECTAWMHIRHSVPRKYIIKDKKWTVGVVVVVACYIFYIKTMGCKSCLA